jgi:hypothetical protein
MVWNYLKRLSKGSLRRESRNLRDENDSKNRPPAMKHVRKTSWKEKKMKIQLLGIQLSSLKPT